MAGNDVEQADTPAAIAQALEVARDSEEGSRDPDICNILERAIEAIWSRVQAGPDCYIMTKGEYSVFTYFQDRFVGSSVAISARKRYWDNASAAS